eukprot:CAMPEP_0114115638 /NCGR_PEP_ID=MMETSP0043_2-20121206/4074_1 /TAXON_ID=464988 /ORGANISM="Hemiselmis andersenii, Strain CCMP644" /LENGTH=85 /DNA_ID=CAMNT_0001207911 /DNA_START=147 /DNA_END=401 /DNA_ORIENTATION=+
MTAVGNAGSSRPEGTIPAFQERRQPPPVSYMGSLESLRTPNSRPRPKSQAGSGPLARPFNYANFDKNASLGARPATSGGGGRNLG